LHLWAEAANYVVYTKNHHPTRSLPTTPFEQRYNSKPDLLRLYRFGCVAYVLDDTPTRRKLDPKGKRALFVGYSETQEGWQIYHPEKRQIQVSAYVKFDDDADLRDSFLAEGETQFSYNFLKSLTNDSQDEDYSQQPIQPALPAPNPPALPTEPAPQPIPPQPRVPQALPPPRAPSSQNAAAMARAKISKIAEQLWRNSDEDTDSSSEAEVADALRGEVSNDEQVNIVSGEEPRTYRQAMSSPDRSEWESAMEDELNSISQLGTYKLVELPAN